MERLIGIQSQITTAATRLAIHFWHHWLTVSNQSSVCLPAFALGICLAALPSEVLIWWWPLLVAVPLVIVRRSGTMPVVLTLLGVSWASSFFSAHHSTILSPHLERVDMRLNVEVLGLPQYGKGVIKFDARVRQAKDQQHISLIGTKIRLSCYRCEFLPRAGQHWQLTARLKRPRGYASWGAFDYERYLFRHRISAVGYVRNKHEAMLKAVNQWSINALRQQIRERIQSARADSGASSDSPGAGVLLALSLGDKSSLSKASKEALQQTGLSHLVAISGLHVTLVFAWTALLMHLLLRPFTSLYRRLSRQCLVMLPSLLVATAYAGLAGFAISTQRALIMLAVFTLTRLCLREQSLLRVLAYSATLILLLDPFSSLDLGFWLSCGAVFIIGLWLRRHPESPSRQAKHQAVGLLQLQPLLWLGMMPLTALGFGHVSLLSPLANLLAVPLFSVLLIPATLVSVMVALIYPPASELMNMVVRLLDIVMHCVHSLAQLPVNHLVVPKPSLGLFLVLTSLLISFATLRFKYSRLLSLIALVITLMTAIRSEQQNELIITLMDVGQGLAMVIQHADHTLIYDTGPSFASGFSAAEAVVLPYLRQQGVTEIDTLIISHADNDHIGGFELLSQELPVVRLLSSRPDKVPGAELCRYGQNWQWGQVHFFILGPDEATPAGSNNQSCVLRLRYRSHTILITGDIEKSVESHMLALGEKLKANVMLVPHQGSKTSSTSVFLDAVNPNLALVAAGYKNRYSHPHPDVLHRYAERNIPVVSTIDSGSIRLLFGAKGMVMERFRQQNRRVWHY